MTPQGRADGPDVAALRAALVAAFRHRLGLAGNPSGPTKWWADDLATLALDMFADRLAAVTAQRDQYAAQVAAEALESAADATPEWTADRVTWGDGTEFVSADDVQRELRDLAARLRAALHADGGDSQ